MPTRPRDNDCGNRNQRSDEAVFDRGSSPLVSNNSQKLSSIDLRRYVKVFTVVFSDNREAETILRKFVINRIIAQAVGSRGRYLAARTAALRQMCLKIPPKFFSNVKRLSLSIGARNWSELSIGSGKAYDVGGVARSLLAGQSCGPRSPDRLLHDPPCDRG